MTPVRSIPTSRAYWELKAEQVLNRVFEPEKPIEVEICDTPLVFSGGAPTQPNGSLAVGLNGLAAKPEQVPAAGLGASAIPSPRQGTSRLERSHAWIDQLGQQPTLVLAGASVAVTILAGLAMTLVTSWNQSQLAIREERNMLMIERLRAMGPASPAAAEPTQSGVAENVAAQEGELQPPPLAKHGWKNSRACLPAALLRQKYSRCRSTIASRAQPLQQLALQSTVKSQAEAQALTTCPNWWGSCKCPAKAVRPFFRSGIAPPARLWARESAAAAGACAWPAAILP